MQSYRVVGFSEANLDGAARIERETFSEPWSRDAMRLFCTEDYPSLALISEDGETVGYIGCARVLDELQIINVAVAHELRKKGLGSLLMQGFEDHCEALGIAFVSLEVRESNTSAQKLYSKFGFKNEGLRKNFYKDPIENAVIMTRRFINENT